ncbi:nucleotide disphospho-sugar-binding domain-containing protein [Dactylosporangium sp. NPDC051485]|uniref:glycosyltransferase n=1 Tax=Dactylosporangium sp. NPDC051485 TaxID=3154846 RepID=UPI00342B0244
MRILFSACPLPGHITTILPLALAARAAGHDVAVATGAGVVPQVRRHRIEAWAVGPAQSELAGGGTAAQRAAFFAHSAARRAEDLVPRAARWAPDLVVSETAEVAGSVAAAVTGARHVVHGLGVMPPIGVWDAYAMHVDSLLARWGGEGSAEVVRAATYLDVCPPALRRDGERIWGNSLDLRPTTAPEGGAPAGIGDLPYRDTIFVRPGTPGDGRAVLAALGDLPANVVVSADPGRYGPQPGHVLISPDVSLASVLPRSRAVISPGGPGIALAALAYGLPQLVLSLETGHAEAGEDAVTHAGAALTVPALGPLAIERAVRRCVPRLLEDPAFADSAAWVQVEIAAMSSPDAIVRALTAEGVPALR